MARCCRPRRSAGRPPGAKNKRTEQLVKWMRRAGYSDPLEQLHEIIAWDAVELAKRLQCAPIEAFREQMKALTLAIRYWHQEQPKAITLDGSPLMQIGIVLAHDQAAAVGLDPAELENIAIEQFGGKPSNSGDFAAQHLEHSDAADLDAED